MWNRLILHCCDACSIAGHCRPGEEGTAERALQESQHAGQASGLPPGHRHTLCRRQHIASWAVPCLQPQGPARQYHLHDPAKGYGRAESLPGPCSTWRARWTMSASITTLVIPASRSRTTTSCSGTSPKLKRPWSQSRRMLSRRPDNCRRWGRARELSRWAALSRFRRGDDHRDPHEERRPRRACDV
jgi:hypothetical protein